MADEMDSAFRFSGLALEAERLALVAAAFAEIYKEIELLQTLDLAETHPAVIFRPFERSKG